MKKILYAGLMLTLAFNSAQSIDTVSAKLLKDINLTEVINALHYFLAVELKEKSAQDIGYKVHKILSKIPDEIAGINITNLKNNKIDAATAQKVAAVLPNAHELAQILKQFIDDLGQALMVFELFYNVVASELPASISNLYRVVLDEASGFINSKDVDDQAAIQAIKRIFNKGILVTEDLYKNRTNLVNYDLTSDLMKLVTTIISEFPFIQEAIKNNTAAIGRAMDAARAVKKEDINKIEDIVTEELKAKDIIA